MRRLLPERRSREHRSLELIVGRQDGIGPCRTATNQERHSTGADRQLPGALPFSALTPAAASASYFLRFAGLLPFESSSLEIHEIEECRSRWNPSLQSLFGT